MHEDAERLARRFHDVFELLVPKPGWEIRVQRKEMLSTRWEDVAVEYRRTLVGTFDELLRAEVIFPGPSLYADADRGDPSV